MATFTWTVTTGGQDWNNTADWQSGGVIPPNPPGSTSTHTDVAIIGPLGATTGAYTVTIGSGESFDLATLEIGAVSGQKNPSLAINGGTLLVDTLHYSTVIGGPATAISIGIGGLFGIRSDITDSGRSEIITISGRGAGGPGSGGRLQFGSLSVDNPNVTYTFNNNSAAGSNTGAIEFLSGFFIGAVTSHHITNIGHLDEIIIDGADFTGDTVSFSSGTLTVMSGITTVFTMNNLTLQSGFTGDFTVSGNTITAVCYARGTMIRTATGEMPIERLRPGTQVMTLAGTRLMPQTVRWLGHRRIDLTAHPHPETVAPVRILRNAFGPAMPQRDLLVSPDHAIFVDGMLICARQLINGATIRQETGWTAVDYYHVELDDHAVLLAEGLPAESYLDTGNAGFFANSGAPLVLHPDLTDETSYPTREAASCAPFVWDEASVRPVWQRLADRAATLGKAVPQLVTTEDAGLHLIAKGRSIRPVHGDSSRLIFVLPRGATEARLVSRAQSPTEARPWLEDRRTLGVRIARIVLRGADDVREVPVDHPSLAQGWWSVERDGAALRRWTSGDAVVPLPTMQGQALLEVHLGGTMTYVLDERRAA